ncbi:MAG: 50S ribosomal protein L23 [Desulfovibrio sp.]|nr:50S ribosomal protein L23 [Desulfovibrio sp.]
MDLNLILLKPHLSEKTTAYQTSNQCVTFMVHPDANKVEIKKAVEALFEVKVVNVNVVRKRPSDRVRQGRVVGRKPGWKKAYVKLAPGDKIELIQGV